MTVSGRYPEGLMRRGGDGGSSTMKAIVYREYGPPDVLKLREGDRPVAGNGEALVRALASAMNPGDMDLLQGCELAASTDFPAGE